jgi:hypothetical protein
MLSADLQAEYHTMTKTGTAANQVPQSWQKPAEAQKKQEGSCPQYLWGTCFASTLTSSFFSVMK